MFKKLFASMGIGSAKVNTLLQTNRVTAGDVLRGEVVVTGGSVAQDIGYITVVLMTQVEVEHGDNSEHTQAHPIVHVPVTGRFSIRENEERRFPFQITIHPETPITDFSEIHRGGHLHNKTHVWVHTELDIQGGVDASDRDYLLVQPTPPMHRFHHALQNAGYFLTAADVERGQLTGSGFYSTIGCYQELEYRPSYGNRFSVREVEVSFVPQLHQTGVLVEVDRTWRGDGFRSFLMNHANYGQVNWEAELGRLLG